MNEINRNEILKKAREAKRDYRTKPVKDQRLNIRISADDKSLLQKLGKGKAAKGVEVLLDNYKKLTNFDT